MRAMFLIFRSMMKLLLLKTGRFGLKADALPSMGKSIIISMLI